MAQEPKTDDVCRGRIAEWMREDSRMDEGASELDAPHRESLLMFMLITACRNAVLGLRRGRLMLCFCWKI